jgi:hypothetical protein
MEAKKYFVILENVQLGPLTFSELKLMNLKNTTPIWFEGINEWTLLEKIEELEFLKKVIPPVYDSNKNTSTPPNIIYSEKDNIDKTYFKKNNKAIWIIIPGVLLIILFSYLITSNNIDTENIENSIVHKTEYSPVDLKKELLVNEQKNPLQYLNVSASFKENKIQTRNGTFFRSSKWEVDGYLVDFNVSNKANIATYKDIRIKISFRSKTNSEINSKVITIYDYVKPNNSINHKDKIYFPDGTIDLKFSILGCKS